MDPVIEGKVRTFGDNINTDIISPPQYMELPIEEAAKYAMSGVDEGFAAQAGADTIIVAGTNFGSGSSRELSPLTLKFLGVRVILARSFARIFYRNGINIGLVLLECPETGSLSDGDRIRVHLREGRIENVGIGAVLECDRVPDHILRLIEVGGLVADLKRRFGVS